jgi:hypothetical protein
VAVGRDPATLLRTVGIHVDAPIDQSSPSWLRAYHAREGTVAGSPEVIAQTIRGFAQRGITQVQVDLEPNTVAGIEAFAPVLALLDAGE